MSIPQDSREPRKSEYGSILPDTRKQREFEYGFQDFDRLRKLSFAHSGIRVPDDKQDMFYSRLSKRLRHLGLTRFSGYCDLLEREPGEEFTDFINAITTNLTSFFRENHHFDYLRAKVLPGILAHNAASKRIRIWSAGCSTGEEPYSIAITLLESAPQLAGWDLRILATDLDTQVLATAASGVYPMERVQQIPEARLRRWFLKGGAGPSSKARIKPELRALIRFNQLNLMGPWRMKGPFDLIFCRNVLIYFDTETKRKLVERFAQLLAPEGHLFIGHSESLHTLTQSFRSLGHTMYRKSPELQR